MQPKKNDEHLCQYTHARLNEILSDFFETNDPSLVEEQLWDMFVGFIGNDETTNMFSATQLANMATLQKQLATLVKKLQSVHLENSL